MIHAKPGFLMRKLGDDHMIVAIGEASQQFNGMVRLNATGAFYWNMIERGTTREDLVAKTLEMYDGVDQETACRDVEAFLQAISFALDRDQTDY
ncbi:PqqD family protein [Pseudoflavonifractor phocaeensis]|uniref:PqqD family protein n=1 Tax=Pseudoflavonifractor phocaeensis TaxID=1870988 RepID=UPI0019597316|nr:PqqD family protein [Pseudoflavonifractor phocaeensis]